MTTDTNRTDHSDVIDELRTSDIIEYNAAADLLELHDATGLNLHQAPGLLRFVQLYASYAMEESVEIEPNNV